MTTDRLTREEHAVLAARLSRSREKFMGLTIELGNRGVPLRDHAHGIVRAIDRFREAHRKLADAEAE